MAAIYVSSSFTDLREHREAVYETLRQMRHDVIAMEDYVASDQRPLAKCLQDVEGSDLYVGIFAWRYGYVPTEDNPLGLSITELEYRRAAQLDKPCLIFLLEKGAAWPPPMMDAVTGEGDSGRRILALRDELEKRYLRATFTTPDELARKVSVAVQQELVRVQEERIASGIRQQREINAQASELRAQRVRDRVVGQPMLDVADRFRGRVTELEELGRLLAEPSTNLVSVIGRAGIGKTALACKVLEGLEQNRWPHTAEETPVDGIVYLGTRTTGVTLERVFLACAQMLGGDREQQLLRTWSEISVDLDTKIDRLLRALAGGVYVLLLDHLEDLLDDQGRMADDTLREFLERALVARHDARLLMTSRIPLALPPEARAQDHQLPLDAGLAPEDGTAMLRDLDPGGFLKLRDATEEALAKVVDRLHGIPRALEAVPTLLTKRPFDTLDEVLARFYGEDDIINALVTDAYRTLDGDGRKVVDALAVFGRPAPLWAVEFVVARFAPGLDVPTILTRLVWSRMVTADRDTKTASLHPVDRDIIFERLADDGEYSRRALERRVAEYYAQLHTPMATWRTLVDIEPYLLEFQHRLAAGDVDEAARVLSEVDIPFMIFKGFTRRAVSMRTELTGRIEDRRLQLLHAAALGQAFVLLGPPEKSIEWMEVAAAIARELGDREQERQANGWIGEANRRLGRVDEAVRILRQVVADYDPTITAPDRSALLEYGLACAYAGDFETAVATGNRLLELATQLGDVSAEARGHDTLSLALLGLGRNAEVLEHTARAIELYATTEEDDPLAYVLNVQGMAYVALGRLDEGLDALRRAQRDGKEEDNPRVEGFSLFNLAWATRLAGDLAAAVDLAGQAAAILTSMGAAEAAAAGAFRDGLAAERRGAQAEAAAAYRECARMVQKAPDLVASSYFTSAADALA